MLKMAITETIETIDGGIAVETFLPETVKYEAPLLFVHGSSGGSWMWINFMNYFASEGWTCHALNLRGHHESRPVSDWGEVGVDAYIDDVERVIRWIGKDLVLIGHSMGGVLAQKYAAMNNPLKLILLHTAPPKEIVQKIDFNAFLKRGKEKGRVMDKKVLQSDGDKEKLLGYMFDPGNVDPEILEMTNKKMCQESARAIQEMKEVVVDPKKITCPVYVLGFDLKKIGLNYSLDLSSELKKFYGARDYQVIEPGGHLFMLEKNWQEFAAAIKHWLLD